MATPIIGVSETTRAEGLPSLHRLLNKKTEISVTYIDEPPSKCMVVGLSDVVVFLFVAGL